MVDGEGRFADEDVGTWSFVTGVVIPYLCEQVFCAELMSPFFRSRRCRRSLNGYYYQLFAASCMKEAIRLLGSSGGMFFTFLNYLDL